MRNRVVVTGLGALSPLGLTADALWDGLLAGRSGAGPITRFDPDGYPVKFAAEVDGFDPLQWVDGKDVKKLDRFLQFGIASAEMALGDAGLEITDDIADDVATYIGSGIGGLESICDAIDLLGDRGPRRISPFLIPKILINLASGHVSIRTGARGPNFSHVSACATGNHAIGEAVRLLQYGDAKVAIAGGAEAGIVPLAVAGFAKMRAMSTRNVSLTSPVASTSRISA